MISLRAWQAHELKQKETDSAASSILHLSALHLARWVHRSPRGRRKLTFKKTLSMGVRSTITPRLPGRWAAWRTSSRASTRHMACSRSCPRCPYKTFQLLWHRDGRTKKKCVCVSMEITTTRTNHYMLKERGTLIGRGVLSQEVEQIRVISCWTAYSLYSESTCLIHEVTWRDIILSHPACSPYFSCGNVWFHSRLHRIHFLP